MPKHVRSIKDMVRRKASESSGPLDFDMEALTSSIDLSGVADLLVESDDPADLPDGVALISNDIEDNDDETEPPKKFADHAKQEIGEALTRMKAQAQRARQRFVTTTDTDYYINVVFLSQGQKRAFMDATNWGKYSGGSRYINGLALARALKIELPKAEYAPFEPNEVKKGK